MGNFIIGLIGIALSIAMLKYREAVGNMIGEADWMRKIGGVYNVILITATLIFFFSIAKMTGTTHIFLSPLKFLIPGGTTVQNDMVF